MANPSPPLPPPSEGKIAGLVRAVQGLTLTNVLVIFLLIVIATPTYLIYQALNDDDLLDRLLSTYKEIPSDSGCTLRQLQQRGGPDFWGISSGFAFQGQDRWFVSVQLDHLPSPEEQKSYCESLKLIADRMQEQ